MNQLYIAMYHYIRDLNNSRYPAIKGLDYELFKRQIDFFKRHFNVVTMEEVIEAKWNGTRLPDHAMLLTFDDGYIDHYTFALPVLKAHHMQGAFFIPGKAFAENTVLDVNKIHFVLASAEEKRLLEQLFYKMNYYRGTEFVFPSNGELFQNYAVSSRLDTKETIFIKMMLQTVLPERLRDLILSELFHEFVGMDERKFSRELYMNYEQIYMMKQSGMFIGIHGYDHYWLGELSKEKMSEDIKRALEVMDKFINKDSWVMNYPYGSYNRDTIDFVSSAGCKLGLTTEVRRADLDKENIYEIPRLDTNDFPPKSNNYRQYMV